MPPSIWRFLNSACMRFAHDISAPRLGVEYLSYARARWSVTVKGDDLKYKARYKELNLYDGEPEYSPIGSVDIFTHNFTTKDFTLANEVLTFSGEIQVKKVWRKLDGTTEVVRWKRYVTITITPDTFYLDCAPVYDQDWDRTGTTTHFK